MKMLSHTQTADILFSADQPTQTLAQQQRFDRPAGQHAVNRVVSGHQRFQPVDSNTPLRSHDEYTDIRKLTAPQFTHQRPDDMLFLRKQRWKDNNANYRKSVGDILNSRHGDRDYRRPLKYSDKAYMSDNEGDLSWSGKRAPPAYHKLMLPGDYSSKSTDQLYEGDLYTVPHTSVRLTAQHHQLDTRRRTWSPPTFNKLMARGINFTIRGYKSNDHLDEVNDQDNTTPPNIAPVSGQLEENAHQSLIKPIAFKPVLLQQTDSTSTTSAAPQQVTQQLQQSPQQLVHRQRCEAMRTKTLSPYELKSDTMPSGNWADSTPPSLHAMSTHHNNVKVSPNNHFVNSQQQHADDGYISQDYQSGSHCHSNSSHSNVSHGSLNRSTDSRVSHHTPSPNDTALGDIDTLLREKDATIEHLRETMEKNETAILQVCAEKEKLWEMEVKDINAEWERRWRHHQHKTFQMEQALLLQLFKLQQERKSLRLDIDKLTTDGQQTQHKFTDCYDELKRTKLKLDEVNWELCQKSGEISLLKSQLKESKDETSVKKNEILNTKTQLKTFQKSSDEKDQEILSLEAKLKSLTTELENTQKESVCVRQNADLKQLQLEMKNKELEKLHIDHNKLINQVKSSPKNNVDVGDINIGKLNNIFVSEAMSPGIVTSPLLLSPHSAINNSLDDLLQVSTPLDQHNSVSIGLDQLNSPVSTPLDQDNSSVSLGLDQVNSPKVSAQLNELKCALNRTREEFKREREQWLEEKNKVIRYQKHLQLNYVQMYRKNKVLESEVQQLTLELEKRDICLMDKDSAKRITEEESLC